MRRLSWRGRLLRNATLAAAMIGVGTALSAPASAARMEFGTHEDLRRIANIDLKGPNGEALYLAHKISRHSFMLPYTMSDDGYVLGAVGELRRYFRLDATLTAKLQAQKLLPDPLPPYSISWLDYVMGYFLWFVLAGIALSVLVASLVQRRRKGAASFVQAGPRPPSRGQPRCRHRGIQPSAESQSQAGRRADVARRCAQGTR
jgi:hypothetical protein